MPALATVVDLQHVTGTTVDATRAGRLLELASAAAERYAGRRFARVVNDPVTVLVGSVGWLTLPNGPIVSVASIVNPTGTTVAAAGYTLSGVKVLRTSGGQSGYNLLWDAGRYTVTYTHGYSPIPDDVILAVCQMAARHLLAGGTAGLTQSTKGPFSESYRDDVGAGLFLSGEDESLLAPYRRSVGSVQLTVR